MCVPQTTTLGKGIYNKRRGQIHERDSIQQLKKKDTKFPNDDVCVWKMRKCSKHRTSCFNKKKGDKEKNIKHFYIKLAANSSRGLMER